MTLERGHTSFSCDVVTLNARGGVEDTRLEAKDTKKSEAKAKDSPSEDRPFRGQTLSKPRTGMLEAKAKDQGHKHCSLKKGL